MSGINMPKVDECVLPGATAADVSAEAVDRYLDLVLRASGSALRNYSMPTTLDAMRAVMRDAMRGGDVHVAVPESSAGPLHTAGELDAAMISLESAARDMLILAGSRAFYDAQDRRNKARERITRAAAAIARATTKGDAA